MLFRSGGGSSFSECAGREGVADGEQGEREEEQARQRIGGVDVDAIVSCDRRRGVPDEI